MISIEAKKCPECGSRRIRATEARLIRHVARFLTTITILNVAAGIAYSFTPAGWGLTLGFTIWPPLVWLAMSRIIEKRREERALAAERVSGTRLEPEGAADGTLIGDGGGRR